MSYVVTRQHQWPEGTLYVELETGGPDYTSPDQLVAAYAGEGEFEDPRDAAAALIRVRDAWQRDKPDEEILASIGTTGGGLVCHSPEEMTDEEIKQWGQKRWESLPKCDRCKDAITDKEWTHPELDWESFCSESCCNLAYEAFEEYNEEILIEGHEDYNYWDSGSETWVDNPEKGTIYYRGEVDPKELPADGIIINRQEAIDYYNQDPGDGN